jgi:hypothetical protein
MLNVSDVGFRVAVGPGGAVVVPLNATVTGVVALLLAIASVAE